ncbi:DUF2145 domain-containing protein [Rhodoferax sp.]|uniref:DUF2145 domain-containing protein n=1 Tax=Rhodoferax sp. TaxID=50421 RepID=UPI002753A4C5|nr:DUF2145 domain-containing protein [Rhodoferax sp.]
MVRLSANAPRQLALALITAIALAAPAAHAGRSCAAPYPPKAQVVEHAMTLAERTLHALDQSGAQVVVLARAGQDLSKYGLRYSHLGLAYRQGDGKGGHVWRVLHKLNQCGTAESGIYRQGLGEFFLDDLWRFEAAWAVPTPAVQTKLLALLQDQPRALQLHHQPYNMVAYPWSLKYQQSNQWAIETLAMAIAPEMAAGRPTRQQAQAWLQASGYQPTTLKIGAATRLGARLSKANVAFDDHPNDKRFSDQIDTVTVDSVFTWLARAGLAQAPVSLGR